MVVRWREEIRMKRCACSLNKRYESSFFSRTQKDVKSSPFCLLLSFCSLSRPIEWIQYSHSQCCSWFNFHFIPSSVSPLSCVLFFFSYSLTFFFVLTRRRKSKMTVWEISSRSSRISSGSFALALPSSYPFFFTLLSRLCAAAELQHRFPTPRSRKFHLIYFSADSSCCTFFLYFGALQ